LRAVRETFVPQRVVAWAGQQPDTLLSSLLEGRAHRGGKASAYVCRGFTCLSPVDDPHALIHALL
jgi:uncharacterized protein YyaL (SSP411 family)